MKTSPYISGITFVKNGLRLGYPIKESIASIDPICDEIIINVGHDDPQNPADDGTYEYLRDSFTSAKYHFIRSWWDPAISSRGLVLAQQTNLALAQAKGRYCQYIQADESLHEQDYPAIMAATAQMDQNPHIMGLVYNYWHFYGNVDAVIYTRRVYRREVRLIRNNFNIQSYLDAQGFRHADNTKLLCQLVNATVYHYGWARQEQVMNKKLAAFGKLYHGENYQQSHPFSYQKIWGVRPFNGTHPQVMAKWIQDHHNEIDINKLPLNFKWTDIRHVISDAWENWTGHRMGEYKNYLLSTH